MDVIMHTIGSMNACLHISLDSISVATHSFMTMNRTNKLLPLTSDADSRFACSLIEILVTQSAKLTRKCHFNNGVSALVRQLVRHDPEACM